MANQLGILIGRNHTRYTHPSIQEPKQLVATYLRKVIEMQEGITIPKGSLKEAVQKYVNEYGETVVENQFNDYGKVEYPIVSFEDVAYHLSYMGWITMNGKTIDNGLHGQLLADWMKAKGISDYDGSELAKSFAE
jgi:hypothetical protein